jgi:predicted TIM-barrel fold metal-dependent hydrolase
MTTPHKTVTQSTCLPPDAHIHLWNASAKRYTPKLKSTFANGILTDFALQRQKRMLDYNTMLRNQMLNNNIFTKK